MNIFLMQYQGNRRRRTSDAYIRLLDLAGAQDMSIPDLSEYLDYVKDTLKGISIKRAEVLFWSVRNNN